MPPDRSSSQPGPSTDLIEATAAAWLSLRDRGMNAVETAEFVRWLQQDPQHAAIFADLDRVWQDFDRLGAVPAPASVITPAPDGDLLAPRVRRRWHGRLAWTTAGAAAAVAMLLLVAYFHIRAQRHTAETAIGAFQKLDLPDGSVAQLNTDSGIEMDFSVRERRVRVVRGEVFFTVTKDPARPFIVTAGTVAVRAVGTAFNVRRRENAVEVLVAEGQVRLDDASKGQSLLAPADAGTEPQLLVAGERATVTVSATATDPLPAFATVAKVTASEVQRALAWQERRLEFDSTSLAEVVREFNRYNRRRLVIADPELANRRFSGIFRADGYEALVRLLEEDFGVTVTRSEHEIVLRVRR